MSGVQVEWGKLGLLLIALLGGIALIITGSLGDDQTLVTGGFSLVTGVVGYVTGNGRLASKGEPSVPAIGMRPARVESDHVDRPVAVVVAPPSSPSPSHVPK